MDLSRSKLLNDLRSLPKSKLTIRHHPPTKRYLMEASAWVSDLIEGGQVVGWRRIDPVYFQSIEIVLFREPNVGKDCGLYACIRLHYSDESLENATMFCFYNGTDKSPCFKNMHDASSWMNNWGLKNSVKYEEDN